MRAAGVEFGGRECAARGGGSTGLSADKVGMRGGSPCGLTIGGGMSDAEACGGTSVSTDSKDSAGRGSNSGADCGCTTGTVPNVRAASRLR
jgi:hypothetical protein